MCHPVVLTLITNVNDITPNFILVYVLCFGRYCSHADFLVLSSCGR